MLVSHKIFSFDQGSFFIFLFSGGLIAVYVYMRNSNCIITIENQQPTHIGSFNSKSTIFFFSKQKKNCFSELYYLIALENLLHIRNKEKFKVTYIVTVLIADSISSSSRVFKCFKVILRKGIFMSGKKRKNNVFK